MRAVGLDDGQYIVRVNNRKLLDGILEACGVANTDAGAEQRLRVLRAIDKLDRLGEDGVAALLGDGRKDESGDFTEGAGLGAGAIKQVLGFTTASKDNRGESLAVLEKLMGASRVGLEGIAELKLIDDILSACGFGYDRVVFDTSIVRGLGYYTGVVFEAELLADIKDKKGRPVRIGSVGGGGRYDGLVSRFMGQEVPATGFSFGVSRFANALSRMNMVEKQDSAPVFIAMFDTNLAADYFTIANELRADGIKAEVFVGGGNLGKQLKYADRRGVKLAIIMGSDEAAKGEVTIKDLELGAQKARAIKTNQEWKSSRPAQTTVKRKDLLAIVKQMLKA